MKYILVGLLERFKSIILLWVAKESTFDVIFIRESFKNPV